MSTQHKSQPQNENDFFESIINVAKDIAANSQVPAPNYNDRSRTINNIRVNVVVHTDHRPGLLRRLLAKIF